MYLVGLLELGNSFKSELQGFYISFYNVSWDKNILCFLAFDRDGLLKAELLR